MDVLEIRMPRTKVKLDRLDQADKVLKRLQNEPPGLARERLLAVKLGLEGELKLQEIAATIGRSRATIQTWFDLFRNEGIERLCRRSNARTGRPTELTATAQKELRKKIAKGSFRRVDDARVWLRKQFKIEAPYETVRGWLGKLGARLKVVRPRHPNSSELKRFSFRTQLARQMLAALKERGIERNTDRGKRPIRIWVSDEARFGLQPSLRKAWAGRGVRVHKSSSCRYDWQYIWGALQVGGGGSEFLYTNRADGDMSEAFLKQISQRDPYAIHIMIWDGASFHPANTDPRIPDNVVVLRQPPYSPELNPVEKLWDMLRDWLCNRRWGSLEELLEAATYWLKNFWNEPKRIYSLVGDGWMRHQANV